MCLTVISLFFFIFFSFYFLFQTSPVVRQRVGDGVLKLGVGGPVVG
jgi:hypothetical protein